MKFILLPFAFILLRVTPFPYIRLQPMILLAMPPSG
jgi:hypothetical protein